MEVSCEFVASTYNSFSETWALGFLSVADVVVTLKYLMAISFLRQIFEIWVVRAVREE